MLTWLDHFVRQQAAQGFEDILAGCPIPRLPDGKVDTLAAMAVMTEIMTLTLVVDPGVVVTAGPKVTLSKACFFKGLRLAIRCNPLQRCGSFSFSFRFWRARVFSACLKRWIWLARTSLPRGWLLSRERLFSGKMRQRALRAVVTEPGNRERTLDEDQGKKLDLLRLQEVVTHVGA